MSDYGRDVRKILRENDCSFLRQGRGDHEVWTSPHAVYPDWSPQAQAVTLDAKIRYYADTDTMAIEVRPWPEGVTGDERPVGGEDAGEHPVAHHAADGEPWLWEIEHASHHPEHITAALAELPRRSARAAV